MPNHVTHLVEVSGDSSEIARFKQLCIREQTSKDFAGNEEKWIGFDFNSLIPIPEDIYGSESSNSVSDGFAILGISPPGGSSMVSLGRSLTEMLSWPWVVAAGVTNEEELKALILKRSPNCVELAQKALARYEKYGHMDWYSWSISNWGTKWNAYSFSMVEEAAELLTFRFETAWSTPEPIWNKIAEEFPKLKFVVNGFDEGWLFAVSGVIEEGINNIEDVEPTDEVYEKVYGEAPEKYDE